MVGRPEMAHISNRARDQEVPHNRSFGGEVQHTDPNHTQQTVNITELQGQDLRGRRQGDRGQA